MSEFDLSGLQQQARDYLCAELRDRMPSSVTHVASFAENPLAGEGAVAVFQFDLSPGSASGLCANVDPSHYVFVGQTRPNYVPAYGLSPDDAYSLHIGTRFLLEIDAVRIENSAEPPHVRETMRRFVSGCNPHTAITHEELSLLFRCEDQHFAVYRIQLAGTTTYVVSGELPAGFYPAPFIDHPPQVALRLHLGRLIREEARQEAVEIERASRRTR